MSLNGFRKNVPKCQAATPSGDKGVGTGKDRPASSRNDFRRLGDSIYKGKAACLEKTHFSLGVRWQDGHSSPSKEFLNENQIVCNLTLKL